MKRPKQHEIDAIAKTILNKNAPKNWSMAQPSEDYGIDYLVRVFDRYTKEATSTSFFIQLKGTKNYKKNESHVKFSIGTDYLKYYYNKVDTPVFLVVVDVINEEYCWLFIQKYINEELNFKKPTWTSQKTTTVSLPIKNTFSKPEIIEKCASEGSQYCNILVKGNPTQELIWRVKNITENPSEKYEYIEKKHSELLDVETKVGFEFINENNDLINGKHTFQSIYIKTKYDENNVIHHLKAIAALIPIYRGEYGKTEISKYIDEGLELSKKNNISYLKYYFYGLKQENECRILQEDLQNNLLLRKISENKNNKVPNKIINYLENQISKNNNRLHILYGNFMLCLIKILEDKELYMFLELMRMLLGLLLNDVYITYDFITKNVLNIRLKEIWQLLSVFSNIIDFSEDFTIFKYEYFKYKILYYYLKQDENNVNKYIKEYKELTNKDNVEYQIKQVKSLKQQIAKPLINKYFSNITCEDLLELYGELLLKSEGINLNNNTKESRLLRQSIKDLNPKRVLDSCRHLELSYITNKNSSKLGLYSEGLKILYCKHGDIKSNSNLDEAYNSFYNEYCINCKYQSQQNFKWNPENMSCIKSNEFEKTMKNNSFTAI